MNHGSVQARAGKSLARVVSAAPVSLALLALFAARAGAQGPVTFVSGLAVVEAGTSTRGSRARRTTGGRATASTA